MRRSWGTPTDGIGTRTTAHLNLTRTMADDAHFLNQRHVAEIRDADQRPIQHFPARANALRPPR